MGHPGHSGAGGRMKAKLANRVPVIGTVVTFGDSMISELLACLGYDFVWIDTEHSPMQERDVLQHMMAVQGAGAAAIVRVAWNDPVLVKPILDMGADGILFPMINTAEEAELAVRSCRYPPAGIRGYGPLRASRYGLVEQPEYVRHTDCLKIMQIEHVDGVNHLEAIVQVDGVDAILVGMNDLCASIGRLGQPDHPEVTALKDTIGRIARQTGIPLAAAVSRPADIEEWIGRGIRWLAVGGDAGFVKQAGEEALRSARQSFAAAWGNT